MKTSDLLYSIFIIIVFILLYVANILAVGKKNIEDNWPMYRCSPMIMPFASMFGHNTSKNFAYCIQNMQTDFMSNLLQPANYNLSLSSVSMQQHSDDMNNSRGMFANIRGFLAKSTSTVFGVFSNMMIFVKQLMLVFKDVLLKFVGVVKALMYLMDSAYQGAQSVWNGPPGKLVRALT